MEGYEEYVRIGHTEEYEKYVKIGLQLEPNNSDFLLWYAMLLESDQDSVPNRSDVDYSYIEYYEKSYENLKNSPARQKSLLNAIQNAKQLRDYHTGSIKQINHLIQFDSQPNLDLKEPRWEIYKITLSFLFEGLAWKTR